MFDKPMICRIHGELAPDQVWVEKSKSGYARRCKECREAARNRWALKRSNVVCSVHGPLKPEDMYADGRCKECLNTKQKEYREANKEKIREKNARNNAKRPLKES